MAGSIKVDPAALRSAAGNIDQKVAQYRTDYARMYSEVDGMKKAWTGADNQAFTTQIESFKPDFEKMAKLMEEYSKFLKTAAEAYEKTQSDIASGASKL